MANFNVEGAQNVEISKKLPCEKPLIVQLEIMERYTAVHKACAALPKEIREVECLKVLYPTLFRKITNQDLIAGRTDFPPNNMLYKRDNILQLLRSTISTVTVSSWIR